MNIYFTTSWDDGSTYDMRLANLLSKYGIKGTFYIPIKNEEIPTMSQSEIASIAKKFEIGGHTYSHKVLTSLPDDVAREEIRKGKEILENISCERIYSFAFPRGKYRKKTIAMIQKEGFYFGRTIGYLRLKHILKENDGLMFTTLQFFPHKSYTFLLSVIKRVDGTVNYFV